MTIRLKREDYAALKEMYTLKHGDCLFYTITKGQIVRVLGEAARFAKDYVRIECFPKRHGYGGEISIPIDYLRKLSPLEMLALQAVE